MMRLNTDLLIDIDQFNFLPLSDEENEQVLEHIDTHISQVRGTPTQEQWSSAWGDIGDCESPTYYKPRFSFGDYGVYRHRQKFVKYKYNKNIESVFHDMLLEKIQNKYLTDIDCVVEFGCGTGHNLKKIRERNPEISVFGSDWAGSSQEILNRNNIPSWNFDMTSKQGSLPSEVFEYQDICFLTVGSLEQVGSNWGNFLNFMLDVRPKRSIHIEPIVEFYDSKNEVDKLAIQYHIKRGYLNGFFNGVRELDELKFYQRIPFGNTYNEGFNIIVMEYK